MKTFSLLYRVCVTSQWFWLSSVGSNNNASVMNLNVYSLCIVVYIFIDKAGNERPSLPLLSHIKLTVKILMDMTVVHFKPLKIRCARLEIIFVTTMDSFIVQEHPMLLSYESFLNNQEQKLQI